MYIECVFLPFSSLCHCILVQIYFHFNFWLMTPPTSLFCGWFFFLYSFFELMSISGIVSKNFPIVYGIWLQQFKKKKPKERKTANQMMHSSMLYLLLLVIVVTVVVFCYIFDVENWEMHLGFFYRSCIFIYIMQSLWCVTLLLLCDVHQNWALIQKCIQSKNRQIQSVVFRHRFLLHQQHHLRRHRGHILNLGNILTLVWRTVSLHSFVAILIRGERKTLKTE